VKGGEFATLGHLNRCLYAASGQCSSKVDSAAQSPEPMPSCYLADFKEAGLSLLTGARLANVARQEDAGCETS
jgi:hypothetical protein